VSIGFGAAGDDQFGLAPNTAEAEKSIGTDHDRNITSPPLTVRENASS
jgi:hypothetical protein